MRLRVSLVAVALALGVTAPVVATPERACAASETRAVLVVDTGSAVHRYCVEIGTGSVSGLDVIKLAGKQHGLDYSLGFGGQAVCRLAGVGPSGNDCFADYPEFWGYWHGGSGGWSWSNGGPGDSRVTGGSVEGWSWGSGDDGSSHPKPPVTKFASACPPKPRARPSPEASPSAAPRSSPSPGGKVSAPAVSAEGDEDEAEPRAKKKRKKRSQRVADIVADPAARTATTSRPPPSPDAAAAAAEEDAAPPVGGAAALGAAALIGLVGTIGLRRRRRAP